MLVLTRRTEESLVINEQIAIVALNIKDGQVRLGIEAPKSISIHRKEVYLRIQKEKQK